MKKFFSFIFVIVLFTLTQFAFADSNQDLSQLLDPINTMQSNFSQTIFDKGKTVHAYGRMAVERPGKFRWEVIKPTPQLIIANGSRLWIYDVDLKQATIRALSENESPAILLSEEALGNLYRITKLPQSDPRWQWFSLSPKNSNNPFASVQMGFMNNQIRQMRLQDRLGHNSVVVFNSPRFNTSLSSSQFEFSAPRNVDVIDETRKQR